MYITSENDCVTLTAHAQNLLDALGLFYALLSPHVISGFASKAERICPFQPVW
jgi:hypothetical protein